MGHVCETILAAKDGLSGGGFENLSAGSNDTFSIRAFQEGAKAHLEEIWGLDTAHVCQLSIKSPRMHDQVRGLLLAIPSGAETGRSAQEPSLLLGSYLTTEVYQTDTLSVQVSGTAGDEVAVAMSVFYDDLPGSHARLFPWQTVSPLIRNVVGILVQPTSGDNNYGTAVTLNSVDDRLYADTDYALLGAVTDTPTALISIMGPDTGNYRMGIPGFTDPVMASDWFVQLDQKYGKPHIPVFNSNNKGNTVISSVDEGVGATPNVTLIFAQLNAKLSN